jgi:cytochrome P450 family 130
MTSTPVRYDPEAVAPAEELFRIYARLRDDDPVYVNPDNGSVALSRFADVQGALADANRFSSIFLRRTPHPILAQLDPPRHTSMRKVILRAFTPSRVTAMEDSVRALARELIEGLAERDEVDLARDYAAVLPSTVMGRLLGVPEELIPHCREISDLHMRRVTHADALVPIRMSDELFGPLLDERRRRGDGHERDDLLAALVHAEVDGERLTEDDLLGFCYTLLIGGNDTTTNWIGNGLGVLLRRPDLRRAPVEPFMEEVLRAESPTQVLFRRTTTAVEVHGTTIPAETRVLLVLGAANRDPREFDAPDDIQPARATTRHVALGQGIHFCLGAALARLEARVAVEELLARAPGIAAAGEPERIRSSWALGWERLPADLGPVSPGG